MKFYGCILVLIGAFVLPQAITAQTYDPRQCESGFVAGDDYRAFCEGYRSRDCTRYITPISPSKDFAACQEGTSASFSGHQAREKPVGNQALKPAGVTPPSKGTNRPVTLSPDVGYQCPDGSQLRVVSCYSEAGDANCAVENLHLPLRNGFQLRTSELRRDLVARLQGCQPRGVAIDQKGVVSLTGAVRR
jgi:hypothetical protein